MKAITTNRKAVMTHEKWVIGGWRAAVLVEGSVIARTGRRGWTAALTPRLLLVNDPLHETPRCKTSAIVAS